MVTHVLWEHEIVGSSPTTPTTSRQCPCKSRVQHHEPAIPGAGSGEEVSGWWGRLDEAPGGMKPLVVWFVPRDEGLAHPMRTVSPRGRALGRLTGLQSQNAVHSRDP